MRAFIGVEFSEEIRARIDRAIEPLRPIQGVKWVEAQNLHLTLRFLGEIDGEQAIQSAMASRFKGAAAPLVQVRNFGAFPERGDPRVVWVGIGGQVAGLKDLWERAQTCARDVGLGEDDHGFSPHVTVGRVKERGVRLPAIPPADFGEETLSKVILFESRLSPQGPAYVERFAVALALA